MGAYGTDDGETDDDISDWARETEESTAFLFPDIAHFSRQMDIEIRNKEIHEWLGGVQPLKVNQIGDVSCFMSGECSELSRDQLVSGNLE